MSRPFKYFTLALHIDLKDLDPYEMMLLIYIRCRAGIERDGTPGTCFVQVKKIAKECKMGDRKVRSALKSLEQLGRITIVRQHGETNRIRPIKLDDLMEDNYARGAFRRGEWVPAGAAPPQYRNRAGALQNPA